MNALAKEYNADGIIYEQIKFCDPWAYERMVGSHVLQHDFGYPVLSVDRPYTIAGSGARAYARAGVCGEHRGQKDTGRRVQWLNR